MRPVLLLITASQKLAPLTSLGQAEPRTRQIYGKENDVCLSVWVCLPGLLSREAGEGGGGERGRRRGERGFFKASVHACSSCLCVAAAVWAV